MRRAGGAIEVGASQAETHPPLLFACWYSDHRISGDSSRAARRFSHYHLDFLRQYPTLPNITTYTRPFCGWCYSSERLNLSLSWFYLARCNGWGMAPSTAVLVKALLGKLSIYC